MPDKTLLFESVLSQFYRNYEALVIRYSIECEDRRNTDEVWDVLEMKERLRIGVRDPKPWNVLFMPKSAMQDRSRAWDMSLI